LLSGDEFTSPFLGFCTDDRNRLDIHEEGHIDYLVRRAIALGAPAAAVYRTASWSAARGFGLRDRGLVAPGYLADILLLDDLAFCAVHLVLRRGRPVTEQTFDDRVLPPPPNGNSVRLGAVTARTFAVPAPGPSGEAGNPELPIECRETQGLPHKPLGHPMLVHVRRSICGNAAVQDARSPFAVCQLNTAVPISDCALRQFSCRRVP
jgi:hypothetical protein